MLPETYTFFFGLMNLRVTINFIVLDPYFSIFYFLSLFLSLYKILTTT